MKVKYSEEARTQTGIYAIVNLVNGCSYIGYTAFRFSERWANHLVVLNRGKHNCRALQQDWDRYGAAAFEFRILEGRRMGLDPEMDYLASERRHIATARGSLYNVR